MKREVSRHVLKRRMILDARISTVIAVVHIHLMVGIKGMLEVGGRDACPSRSR